MADKKISISEHVLKLHRLLLLDKKDIVVIYIFALLAGLVQLSLPLGIQSIINFVIAGSITTSIVVLTTLVVFGVFLNGLFQIRQLQIIEKLKQKLFVRYSLEFGDRLPKLNIEKLDKKYLPEMVNRYFETISLQKGMEKLLIDIPAASIQVILGLTLLTFYHPFFIAFGLLLLVIVFTIIRFTSPQGLATALLASKYKYGTAAWLQEVARTVKSFKYTKGTSLHLMKTDELVGSYLNARTRHFKILLMQFWSLISFKIIITAAMLILGSYLLINQQINIGQFIAADIIIIAIIVSIEKLITNLDVVYEAMVSVQKLAKITEAEKEHSGSLLLPNINEGVSIHFNNVTFGYDEENPVLNKVNFSILPGQLVQLKGVSGSGKSTVLRLLTGAFNAYKGNILIDGIPAANYELQRLRQLTGILLGSQDIFYGTLIENITMGDDKISTDDVRKLAEIVGLSSFVQTIKEGYDSILQPVGHKLSKKDRNNILLMRALLGQHRLLLLEEPFIHLEEPFRENTIRYIKENKKVTVLVASQDERLSNDCDNVILLTSYGEISK